MKISLSILVSLILGWNLLVIYIDNELDKNKQVDIYVQCNKVWVSRGEYTDFAKRNTIESVQKAFASGAIGVEFDFHYDTKMNRFIIAHNYPKKNANGELVYEKKNNGKILTIEEFLQAFKDENKYYWFDFKNLDKLSAANSNKAINKLLSITDENLRKHFYIEGSNPLKLSLYADAGFQTLLGMRPLKDSNIFAPLAADAFKIVYYFFNISALAMAYGDEENPYYGEKTEKSFKNIPIFLFHLPHKRELLKKLVVKKNVKVILPESLPNSLIKENVININICKE